MNIALFGCGIWGKKILRDLVTLECMVDVFEVDHRVREEAIDIGANSFQHGLPDGKSFDGFIIATPSSTHRELLEVLTVYDTPIFVEKPLTTSLEDARYLQERMHRRVFVMHVWMYHCGILALSRICQSKELGKVHSLRTRRCNWTSPRKDTDSIWNLAPHDVTICQTIFGYLPEVRFSKIERYASGMARGMIGVLGDDPSFIFEVSNRYERKDREVRLHCEKGVVVLKDERADHLIVYHGDEHSQIEVEKRYFTNTPPLMEELREFVNYLQGGAEPRSNLSHGLQVVAAIDQLIGLDNV